MKISKLIALKTNDNFMVFITHLFSTTPVHFYSSTDTFINENKKKTLCNRFLRHDYHCVYAERLFSVFKV